MGAVVIILLIVLVAANSGTEEPTESAQEHHLAVTSCGPVLGYRSNHYLTLTVFINMFLARLGKGGGVEFRGIPYALPPTGDLRWEAAAPPSRLEHCWQGVLDYPSKKPSECLQLKHPTVTAKGKGSPPVTGSEDCLSLDVYTPRVGYDTPSQVVVVVAVPSLAGLWPGSSSQDSVTPSAKLAAQKNTVFVVPRFRLGPLGFLPRMLLNDTSTVIANGTGIQVSNVELI